jgi:hypothetical protein
MIRIPLGWAGVIQGYHGVGDIRGLFAGAQSGADRKRDDNRVVGLYGNIQPNPG